MVNQSASSQYNPADYINSTTVFGGINKTIISKNFKGGKINNLFGGTEIDFTHADINGVVVLDISQVFGETKLTVPIDWRVETDLSQFFSEVDDKRTKTYLHTTKVLVLKGVSVFAGVDVTTSI
jgi:predicted membrane protein